MFDAYGQSPNDYLDPIELGIPPPADEYLGEIDGVSIAWCHTCGADHYHCRRCTSKACAHIVALVRSL